MKVGVLQQNVAEKRGEEKIEKREVRAEKEGGGPRDKERGSRN